MLEGLFSELLPGKQLCDSFANWKAFSDGTVTNDVHKYCYSEAVMNRNRETDSKRNLLMFCQESF